MKTYLRVWLLGVVVSSLVAVTGCKTREAQAEVPIYAEEIPAVAQVPPAPVAPPAPVVPAPGAPAVAPAAPETSASSASNAPSAPSLPAGLEVTNAGTNAPVDAPPPTDIQPMAAPRDVNLSPAVGEVVKLLEAGVSEDVVLTYIANSTNVFHVDSDAILYLNDLGMSSTVLTALIQRDASPDNQARKAEKVTVQPLPPGVALTQPATNVYPPTINSQQGYAVQAAPPVQAENVDGAVAAPVAQNPAPQVATVAPFYDSLSPYGRWMYVEDYGWAWQPTVAVVNVGWRPYCDRGRWMWTDSGWYWYSDYSWGWAPFHYGRWCSYPRVGWIWVPDTTWGPSWVTWRYTSYHCGWAPLPPHCDYYGGGLYYRGHHVGLEFGFGFGHHDYTWLYLNRFCDPHPHYYYVPRHHAHSIYQQSVVVNNITVNNRTVVNHGVGYQKVARANRGDIPRMNITPEAPDGRKGRMERLENRGGSLSLVSARVPEAPRGERPAPGTSGGIGDRSRPAVPARPSLAGGAPAVTPKAAARTETSGRSDLTVSRPLPNARPRFAPKDKSETAAQSNPGSAGERTAPDRPSLGSRTPEPAAAPRSGVAGAPPVAVPKENREAPTKPALGTTPRTEPAGRQAPVASQLAERPSDASISPGLRNTPAPQRPLQPQKQGESAGTDSAITPGLRNTATPMKVLPPPAPRSESPASAARTAPASVKPQAEAPQTGPSSSPPAARISEPARNESILIRPFQPRVDRPASAATAPNSFANPATPQAAPSRPALNRGEAAPSFSRPSTPAAPAQSYSSPAPTYSTPARSYSAPSAPAPTYSAPPPRPSAPASVPSYSAPAPRPSAPAPSYSAPPSRPSAPAPAPAPSYSPPARSSSPAPSAPTRSAPSRPGRGD